MGAALGSALALTLCVKAHAADIYEAPPQSAYEAPPPPPLDRGIYIKGYIGQANPSVGSTWNEIYNTNAFQIFHEDIKSSPLFGVGIGWQHSHWLRFDITGEYRGDATFLARDRYPGADGTFRSPQPGLNPGTNEYTADIQSWLGLANAYIDMGNCVGPRPEFSSSLSWFDYA